jgi:hypothetical protein
MDLMRADLEIAPKALSKHPNDLARNVASSAVVPDEHQLDLAIRNPPRLCRPEPAYQPQGRRQTEQPAAILQADELMGPTGDFLDHAAWAATTAPVVGAPRRKATTPPPSTWIEVPASLTSALT